MKIRAILLSLAIAAPGAGGVVFVSAPALANVQDGCGTATTGACCIRGDGSHYLCGAIMVAPGGGAKQAAVKSPARDSAKAAPVSKLPASK